MMFSFITEETLAISSILPTESAIKASLMIDSGFSVQVTYDDIVCLVQSSLCIHYAGVGFPRILSITL